MRGRTNVIGRDDKRKDAELTSLQKQEKAKGRGGKAMREACFCGRIGEVEDRELVRTALGEPALECPDEVCGHTDRLE